MHTTRLFVVECIIYIYIYELVIILASIMRTPTSSMHNIIHTIIY